MTISDILPMSHAKYNEQLFRSAAFSDCTIKCQNKLWHLHRAILSPRCEFFWKCFDGPWEESSATISMHDDDPETVERMLRWIYTLEWPEQKNETEPWTADLMLYILADKYGLSALVEKAQEALLLTAQESSDVTRKADSDSFLQHIEDFAEMQQWLYTDPPECADLLSLRTEILQIMAPMMAKHMREQTSLQNLVSSVPCFGTELVEALVNPKGVEDHRRSSADSLHSHSRGSDQSSNSSSRGASPRKMHIPMNEDSEDEFE